MIEENADIKSDKVKNFLQGVLIAVITFSITTYLLYYVLPVPIFHRIYGNDIPHPLDPVIELPPGTDLFTEPIV